MLHLARSTAAQVLCDEVFPECSGQGWQGESGACRAGLPLPRAQVLPDLTPATRAFITGRPAFARACLAAKGLPGRACLLGHMPPSKPPGCRARSYLCFKTAAPRCVPQGAAADTNFPIGEYDVEALHAQDISAVAARLKAAGSRMAAAAAAATAAARGAPVWAQPARLRRRRGGPG